jgi:hypothetical protein
VGAGADSLKYGLDGLPTAEKLGGIRSFRNLGLGMLAGGLLLSDGAQDFIDLGAETVEGGVTLASLLEQVLACVDGVGFRVLEGNNGVQGVLHHALDASARGSSSIVAGHPGRVDRSSGKGSTGRGGSVRGRGRSG